jgi:hypothetical protein
MDEKKIKPNKLRDLEDFRRSKGGRPTKEQVLRRNIELAPDLSHADVRRLVSAVAINPELPADTRLKALLGLLADRAPRSRRAPE